VSADAGDGWEVVTKDPFAANGTAPELTIYTDGTGRLNAGADRALDEPDAVQFLANINEQMVGIAAADSADQLDTFSVTRGDSAGGDVRPRKALERIGIGIETIDETAKIPLDQTGDMLVADCSDLLEDPAADTRTDDSDRAMDGTTSDADASDDEEGGEDGLDLYECRYNDCEFTSASEHGRNIHEGQVHDDEDGELEDHGGTEIPDPEDVPSHETVRECADGVDTVQELADLLDVDVSEARFLARDADVYSDLRDNPPRPGVSRQ
jgi:hypothetical protein